MKGTCENEAPGQEEDVRGSTGGVRLGGGRCGGAGERDTRQGAVSVVKGRGGGEARGAWCVRWRGTMWRSWGERCGPERLREGAGAT